MIHYHGTPIGGNRRDVCRFASGRHLLIPFPNRNDLHIVSDLASSFVFDNGAFTAWKQGESVNFKEYSNWVHEWHRHPSFDWCLIPDVIDGTEDENDDLIKEWEDGGLREFGVPVWHMNESFERLVVLCCLFQRVAIGSSGEWSTPGSLSWWERISLAMDIICDENGKPPVKLHGLRMLNPKIFTRLPLASADSCNAAINSKSNDRFGIYRPPTAGQRAEVIAARIESNNSAQCWITEKENEQNTNNSNEPEEKVHNIENI